jgi:hypothetical protein
VAEQGWEKGETRFWSAHGAAERSCGHRNVAAVAV